jgi:DNA sulfur modification protein DndB
MKNNQLVLPALRGTIGDWIYYSCLIPIEELAKRVKFADEIHTSKELSELIQRSLEGPRAKQIADYLKTKERFFNSLVLATYGGNPDWLEVGDFKSDKKSDLLKFIPESSRDALGFLSLSGNEDIFAIDGQHRLAGIKSSVSGNFEPNTDQISVILVGHKKTTPGLQRTRRLFTTLNKTAVPVNKRDIISLDEDDVMAITCRRLVETNSSFKHPKIAVIASVSLPSSNLESLTTISNLYDILKLVFMFEVGKRTDSSLRFNRPSDERLDHFYKVATDYFAAISKTFKPVNELFTSNIAKNITDKYRGSFGGNILFRPIGLELVTKLAIELAYKKECSLVSAIQQLKNIPTDLASAPYINVIWDPNRGSIRTKGKPLALDLLRYICGLPVRNEDLNDDYMLTQNNESNLQNLELLNIL